MSMNSQLEEGSLGNAAAKKADYSRTFALFCMMGAGANWVFPSALAQQIPYFQMHNPEGLCVATYMNAATNIGIFAVILYLLCLRFVGACPHAYSVPSILIASACGSYLSSFIYSWTVNGVSVYLFLCCAMGGSVGALSSVVMNPFLTKFENNFISASRTGGSACILLSAIIALVQGPGSPKARFSTTSYLLIFSMILTFPVFAYTFIVRNHLGLRHHHNDDSSGSRRLGDIGEGDYQMSRLGDIGEGDYEMSRLGDIGEGDYQMVPTTNTNTVTNALFTADELKGLSSANTGTRSELMSYAHKNSPRHTHINQQHQQLNNNNNNNNNKFLSELHESRQQKSSSGSSSSTNSVDLGLSTVTTAAAGNPPRYSRIPPVQPPPKQVKALRKNLGGSGGGGRTPFTYNISMDSLPSLATGVPLITEESFIEKYCLSAGMKRRHPWLVKALPFCAVVGFVNMNTWGMCTALAPFAFSNVSATTADGNANLALAYELGAILLVLGDLSTTVFHLHFVSGLAAFVVCVSSVYAAASNVTGYKSENASFALVALFSLARFFEAHLVTSAYRAIATDFPAEERETAARAVGTADQFSTTFGTIISTLMVSQYASC